MHVWLAEGALRRHLDEALARVAGERNADGLFLVADKSAFARSGAADVFAPILARTPHHIFSEFEPNPRLEDVVRALGALQAAEQAGQRFAVVGIGGGTAIDIAKLVATLSRQTPAAEELVAGRAEIRAPATPLLAIPTTAGTGSEATQFAVVYVDNVKHSVDHPHLRPLAALIDPQLTASLPPSVTAATGLDCLCQAAEALWSIRSTDTSSAAAETSLALAAAHLPTAVNAPTPEARLAMARAAHLAGLAINTTRTTAPHALSYHLTTHYDVPHGLAVALTFGPILQFTAAVTEADCVDTRGPQHVRAKVACIIQQMGVDSPEDAATRWWRFLESMGLPPRLADVGVTTCSALESLATSANPARLANHPRRLTHASLVEILSGP